MARFLYVKDGDGDTFKLPDNETVRAALTKAEVAFTETDPDCHVFLDFEDDYDGTAFLGHIGKAAA